MKQQGPFTSIPTSLRINLWSLHHTGGTWLITYRRQNWTSDYRRSQVIKRGKYSLEAVLDSHALFSATATPNFYICSSSTYYPKFFSIKILEGHLPLPPPFPSYACALPDLTEAKWPRRFTHIRKTTKWTQLWKRETVRTLCFCEWGSGGGGYKSRAEISINWL